MNSRQEAERIDKRNAAVMQLEDNYRAALEALEKCRNELLGANEYVPSDSWAKGIKEAILQAEQVLGVK